MANCKGNIDLFCYVCGKFAAKDHQRLFKDELKKLYTKKFNQPVFEDVWWVPKVVCKTCSNQLHAWENRERKMTIRVPMFWSEPRGGVHDRSNCYACANFEEVVTTKKMKAHEYRAVESAQIPIFYENREDDTFPSPDVLALSTSDTTPSTLTETETVGHSLYEPGPSGSNKPILVNQDRLDSIVAKLELTQRKSEALAKFLNDNHLLAPGTKVTAYRKRQRLLQKFFLVNDKKTYAYCNIVTELMKAMGIEYEPDDWRLFIDGSKTSLKAVLLHISNNKPSIPVAYSTETKETYDVLKKMLEDIKYDEHKWRVCSDLKVVAILQGMQGGYTKHMCFLCNWDSRYKEGCQYLKRDWNLRGENVPGRLNVQKAELVQRENILLPPLHIKLGIVKNFIKLVYKQETVAKCLHKIFKRLSKAKLKNGMNISLYSLRTRFENFNR